jgi:hypothetical protein
LDHSNQSRHARRAQLKSNAAEELGVNRAIYSVHGDVDGQTGIMVSA